MAELLGKEIEAVEVEEVSQKQIIEEIDCEAREPRYVVRGVPASLLRRRLARHTRRERAGNPATLCRTWIGPFSLTCRNSQRT